MDPNIQVNPRLPHREYVLYCDESIEKGRFYSHFYGGLIIGSADLSPVTERLQRRKLDLNLMHEVKWGRVTDQYLIKYIELVDVLFDEIRKGTIRIRVMFRQNRHVPLGLTREQISGGYFRLYFQFIKHAFGLAHIPQTGQMTRLRLYFDDFPTTNQQAEDFRGFLLGLNRKTEFGAVGISIAKEDIVQVRSHEHVLMQYLDIVLGAMAFRLNDHHEAIPEGGSRRGKRTKAKHELYRHINQRIREIRPGFNVGISTGGGPDAYWGDPYRHWSFVPKNADTDNTQAKARKR